MGPQAEPDDLALERFRQYLLSLARLKLGERLQARCDASDLVQQTLLEAHRKRDQFRGQTRAELAAWLRQMLTWGIADALRTEGRGKRDHAQERPLAAGAGDGSTTAEPAADHSSPSYRAARNEQFDKLTAALAQLPDDQRRAVELKHLDGCSVADVARLMGKTETAVGGLLRRGLTRLRQLLHDPQEGP
jgi:RNA polymerase sigma-70 factor (ECF subfamily)